MPHLRLTEAAVADLSRLRHILAGKNPLAAQRAVVAIRQRFALLTDNPEAGRPLPHLPPFRELVIPFGDGGYLARYVFETQSDTVLIVAIRHQKEVGY